MNMTRESISTKITLELPESVTISGIEVFAERCEDDDGDYIEYVGMVNDTEWDINIWLSGFDANVRASIDCDELDIICVDLTKTVDLTDAILEIAKEIEEEIRE